MRVLHVIPSVSRLRGGPSQALLELCRASRQCEGISHSIVTTNDNADGIIEVDVTDWIEYGESRVRFFPRWSPPIRSLREFAFGIGMRRWLRANVRQFDLVHVHAIFSYAPSVAMQVARAAGIPYIVRPSGLLGTWPLRQSALKKRCFLKLFDRCGLNGASAIEFTSELEESEASVLGLKVPTYVLPYGMEFVPRIPNARRMLQTKVGINQNARILLFLSRIHPKKGLEVLLESLSSLEESDWILLIAGNGTAKYEHSIRNQITQLGLSEKVRLVGFVTGEFKQILLQGADVFVLPSFSESFAIAVMEALAAGCPVVTTPGVPLASIVESHNFGWVAPPTSQDQRSAIRAALQQVDNISWRNDIRERGPDVMMRNFSWSVIALRTLAAYRSILSGKTPNSYRLDQVQ